MSTRRHRSATSRFIGTKLGRLMLAGPLVGLMSVPALAGPEGEQVVRGSAQFIRHGNNTIIRTSNTAIINYSGFDLASYESVRFIQPGANSRVLNRISSGTPTFINGSVTANGNVYFVNNAGIVFGQNAVFNVGGLFAAAGNISNRDFIAGRDRFTNVTGEVINRGRIEAGSVGLVGHRVANYGSIVAPEGLVTMAAGDDVYIGQRGSHVFARISVSPDSAPGGGIEQAGSIVARGAMLSVGDHFALAVLDSSSIRAERLTVQGGRNGSTVTVSGDIDATRSGDRGGRVDVFGDKVVIDGATIDASGDFGGGVIRIGGDYQGLGLSPTSSVTLVTPDSLLKADAVLAGRGGRVIVWGDQFTGFAGYISARGGALGGDGGFVEVSGKDTLAYRGLADVRAVKGRSGKLLLDPKFINIIDGTGGDWDALVGADNELLFSEDTETVTITDELLTQQLDLLDNSGEILLQAATDIRLRDGVSVVSTGDGLLILEAGRRVRFEGNALLDLGTGSLRVIANSDGYVVSEMDRDPGAANISMSADSQILTDGGTVELFLQDYGDAANISLSTIDAGTGIVRIEHTGLQGAGNRRIEQVSGGLGITAGTVEISTLTTGNIGLIGTRMLITTDSLSVSAAGGNSFLDLTGATVVTGIDTSGGNIDIVSNDLLTFGGDVDLGVGEARIVADEMADGGGRVIGSRVSLEATAGAIGASDARVGVTADLISASAQDGIFLDTQDNGAGLTVGSFNGLDGLVSATGTIELIHTGDLTLDREIVAIGHGLSEDVIRVDASTVTFLGGGGVQAGATGGIVFNTDSFTIDGDLGMTGRAVAFNVGNGGVTVNGVFGSAFETVTLDTTGALTINSGGRLATTGSLTSTAQSYDIASGDGLNADTALTVVGRDGLDADAGFLGELETGGTLTLRALNGDVTLGGQVALFNSASDVVLDASQQVIFDGVAATAYQFTAITATGGTGIEFTGQVTGLDVTGAGLLDAGTGDLVVLRTSAFSLSGGTLDLRSNLLAQQAGGGLVLDGTIDVSTGAGRYDILTDTGGLVVNGTVNTGGRNIQILTDGGAMVVNGLVDSTGVTDGNITANIGAGTLSLTGEGIRLEAGTGEVALNADSWLFDGQFLENIHASTVTILSTVGNTVVTGPSALVPTIDLVNIFSDNGLVRLEGAGTYLFNDVNIDGNTGIEFGAGVDALTATNAVTLSAGSGLVDFQNATLFTLTSGASGTVLNNDVNAAGSLRFVGAIDATNSQGLPAGVDALNLTVNGTLSLDNGLNAGTRNVVIDANDGTLGGTLLAVDVLILNDEISVGNNNGGFWVSNGFLDFVSVTSLRLGEAGNEASQVWLDGISTSYNQLLSINSSLIDAINNNSAVDNVDLVALDRIFVDGVRLEVTGAGRNLRLEAVNGIVASNGATLAASGFGSLIDLNSDLSGVGNVTFAGNLQINGAGIRSIARDTGDTGTIRFQNDVDAAAGQGLLVDAADGDISFGTGNVGQNSAFSSIEMAAAGNIASDGALAITSDGSVTIHNDVNASGRIDIVVDADGTGDGSDVGTFAGLNSEIGQGDELGIPPVGITVTNGLGDAGNTTLVFNGLLRVRGFDNQGVVLNAGVGTTDILGGIDSDIGSVLSRASSTTLDSNILTNNASVLITDGLFVTGDRSVTTADGSFEVQGLTVIDDRLRIDTMGLGGGLVTFGDAILGSGPGVGTLSVEAGTGDIIFDGAVGRTGVDQHLALFEITGGNIVFFRGETYEAVTHALNATEFRLDMPGGGTTEFVSRGGDMTFTGGPIRFALDNDLMIRAQEGGSVVLTDVFADLADNDANLTALVRDSISFAGLGEAGRLLGVVDVTAGDDVMPGLAIFNGAAFSDQYVIAADEINFLGGFGSITGRDMTITQRDLDRGINMGGDGTDLSRLNLTKDDVDALADGFEIVRIGDADTNDVLVIANIGDAALEIRDPFELRAETRVSVLSAIDGLDNASLAMFSGTGTLLNADISLAGGNLIVTDLAGAPGQVLIQDTVRLTTMGGSVTMAGPIDGASGITNDLLFIDAGTGAIVLGPIGQTEAIDGLNVVGGTIEIDDIGTVDKAGVSGGTLFDSDDTLTFIGGVYNTNRARYSARRGMMADLDIDFLSNGEDVAFGSTAQRGRGSIVFGDSVRVWNVDAGGGMIGLDGTYEGTNVDMRLIGASVMLDGNVTFTNPSGLVEFDGLLQGRRNLTMTVANGDVRFLQNVGSNLDSTLRLRDMNIEARRIDFLGARVDADSARFAAVRYGLDPQNVPPIQTFSIVQGNLVFEGGLVLFSTGQLNLNAENGEVRVTEIRGGLDATNLSIRGRDGVTMMGLGSGNNSGVQDLFISGNEMDFQGDMFVRGRTLLRPHTEGVVIEVGSPLVFGDGVLELSQDLLDRFVSTRIGSTLSIGGISGFDDLQSPLVGSTFSGSQINIRDIMIGRQISFFGENIELLGGSTLTMTGGAPVRLSSVGVSRLNGSIVSEGGEIVINGQEAILNGLVNSNGGDIIIRSENAFVDQGAMLTTLGDARDGDFIVDGGVDGLTEGTGDFVLNVGRGQITLAAGRGFGQTRRLRTVSLTANMLDLTNVLTTGDQNFIGTDLLRLSGGVIDSTGGTIRFNNEVSVAGEQFVGVGSEGTIFMDRGIMGAGQNKNLEILTLAAAPGGGIELRGDASGVDGLIVGGDALLFGDRIFSGGEVRFLGLVDTAEGKTALEIHADSVAELAGSVGSQGLFTTVTVSAGDEIILGRSGEAFSIDTCGQQRFEGDVRIAGDVFLQSHGFDGVATRQDSILFLGNVEGTTAGMDSLTAIVDRSNGEVFEGDLFPPTTVPIIGFGGNVGATTRLGELNLNFVDGLIDGRMNAEGLNFASAVATVVFGDIDAFVATGSSDAFFSVRSDAINMGRGEAMTVIGGIEMVGLSGRMSDVSTLNDMTLDFANELTIVNRIKGQTFDPIAERFTDDEGTDFVAGGLLTVRVGPGGVFSIDDEGIEVPGKISFAAIGAAVNFSIPQGFLSRVQLRSLPQNADTLYVFDIETLPAEANGAVLSERFLALDVRSAGPTNTNIAEAIAGAVQNADNGEVESGTVVEATIRDILRELGLEPRGYAIDYADNPAAQSVVTETMLGSLDGAGLFEDVTDIDGNRAIETTIERLDRNLTIKVVTQYLLLWYGPRDANGKLLPPSGEAESGSLVPYGKSVEPSEAIRQSFEKVTEDCLAWLESTDPETAKSFKKLPAEIWMAYLIEHASEYPAASEYVVELERLMTGLVTMGLSQDELKRVWDIRLEKIVPRGLDKEGFRMLLAGEQNLQIATDADNNGREPVIEME
jgi:filamentous hemagglutinin family protein